MANSVFQSVIVQLKEIAGHVFGVIDGDGSIGFTKVKNKWQYPYLSLTTKSEKLKEAFHNYLLKTINVNEKWLYAVNSNFAKMQIEEYLKK